MRSINLLILFGIWSGRSQSLYLSIRRAIKQIVVIIEAYHLCQLRTKLYPALSMLTPYAEEIIGDHHGDFDATGQLLIIYTAFVKYLRKKWEYNEAVHQFFIDFKKAYGSVRREVLYNILTEWGFPMKLVRLIKICLNETCSSSDMFPVKNGFRQGDALSSLVFNFVLECTSRRVQINQDGLKLNGTYQLLVYADGVNLLGGSIHTIEKNTEALVVARKETGLEVYADKTKYMIMS